METARMKNKLKESKVHSYKAKPQTTKYEYTTKLHVIFWDYHQFFRL